MGAYAEINLHVEDVTCEPSSARSSFGEISEAVNLGHTSTAVRHGAGLQPFSRTNYVR